MFLLVIKKVKTVYNIKLHVDHNKWKITCSSAQTVRDTISCTSKPTLFCMANSFNWGNLVWRISGKP